MSLIFCISGKIASGKSTITDILTRNFGFTSVSFGDFVRRQAILRGLDNKRETLQNLGQMLKEENLMKFCNDVLLFSQWDRRSNLVIDGVRHKEVFEAIKTILSQFEVYLIYISIAENERLLRTGQVDLVEVDSHLSERDVMNELPKIADITIDGSVSISEIESILSNWISVLINR